MYVRIRSAYVQPGEQDTVINISKTAQIKILRKAIFKELGIEVHKQCLFYRGKQLLDTHTIFEYGVQLNDVIQLLVRDPDAKSAKFSRNKVNGELGESSISEVNGASRESTKNNVHKHGERTMSECSSLITSPDVNAVKNTKNDVFTSKSRKRGECTLSEDPEPGTSNTVTKNGKCAKHCSSETSEPNIAIITNTDTNTVESTKNDVRLKNGKHAKCTTSKTSESITSPIITKNRKHCKQSTDETSESTTSPAIIKNGECSKYSTCKAFESFRITEIIKNGKRSTRSTGETSELITSPAIIKNGKRSKQSIDDIFKSHSITDETSELITSPTIIKNGRRSKHSIGETSESIIITEITKNGRRSKDSTAKTSELITSPAITRNGKRSMDSSGDIFELKTINGITKNGKRPKCSSGETSEPITTTPIIKNVKRFKYSVEKVSQSITGPMVIEDEKQGESSASKASELTTNPAESVKLTKRGAAIPTNKKRAKSNNSEASEPISGATITEDKKKIESSPSKASELTTSPAESVKLTKREAATPKTKKPAKFNTGDVSEQISGSTITKNENQVKSSPSKTSELTTNPAEYVKLTRREAAKPKNKIRSRSSSSEAFEPITGPTIIEDEKQVESLASKASELASPTKSVKSAKREAASPKNKKRAKSYNSEVSEPITGPTNTEDKKRESSLGKASELVTNPAESVKLTKREAAIPKNKKPAKSNTNEAFEPIISAAIIEDEKQVESLASKASEPATSPAESVKLTKREAAASKNKKPAKSNTSDVSEQISGSTITEDQKQSERNKASEPTSPAKSVKSPKCEAATPKNKKRAKSNTSKASEPIISLTITKDEKQVESSTSKASELTTSSTNKSETATPKNRKYIKSSTNEASEPIVSPTTGKHKKHNRCMSEAPETTTGSASKTKHNTKAVKSTKKEVAKPKSVKRAKFNVSETSEPGTSIADTTTSTVKSVTKKIATSKEETSSKATTSESCKSATSTALTVRELGESKYYKITDLVDYMDPDEGAWFEGLLVDIFKTQKPSKTPTLPENKEPFLVFKVKNIVSCNIHDLSFDEIRPRAYYYYKLDELALNQIVLANYHMDKPNSRGFWYECIITNKDAKTIEGTILMGLDKTPYTNCTLKFTNEILRMEEPVVLTERKKIIEEIPHRKTAYFCKKCQDDPDKKCRDCGCQVCAGKHDTETMILCDECDCGYHFKCLTPPLEELPSEEEWFCPDCEIDRNEIVNIGDKLKFSTKRAKMASSSSKNSKRDWGRGMATVGRTSECTIVNKNHFGPIPGVDVGTNWRYRIQVAEVGVHRPHVAGIHGSSDDGAYSIVLSGGYEDDIDNGEEFVYTGSGGRDLSGNKRVNVQSKDQTLTRYNRALAMNCNTILNENGGEADDWKAGKPVRVVRNANVKNHSKYAPAEGNRYDGIYKVVKYYPATGLSGFVVWKYVLRRDDPIPAPWQEGGQEFEMISPPGYEEAQKQKENAKRAAAEKSAGKNTSVKKGTKRKHDVEIPENETPQPTKKVKIQPMTFDKTLTDQITNDDDNKILWDECKQFVNEGKKKFLEKVEELFMCICCQNVVCQPIIMQCKHNVCKTCLMRSFESEIFNCPHCRLDLTKDFEMIINEHLQSALLNLFPGYNVNR